MKALKKVFSQSLHKAASYNLVQEKSSFSRFPFATFDWNKSAVASLQSKVTALWSLAGKNNLSKQSTLVALFEQNKGL